MLNPKWQRHTTWAIHHQLRRLSASPSWCNSDGTPISADEFGAALSSIWKPAQPVSGRLPRRMALAVSGGVDSMALAALTREYALARATSKQDHIVAFIVDHKARPNSTEEALHVKALLQNLGLKAKVLEVKWPAHIQPADLPDFEGQARRHRYRLLGLACRHKALDSLFVAHHQEDQAETVLQRLVNGRLGRGLIGIKAVAPIPECHGLYGVHESGQLSSNTPYRARVESGGVQVYRPLLEFPKSRLVATCKERGVEWVEDPTNQDPTLTGRNAIRSLITASSLPRAIGKESLLALSDRQLKRKQSDEQIAKRLFAMSSPELETRSGVLRIRSGFWEQDDARAMLKKGSVSDQRSFLSALIQYMINLVGPDEPGAVPSLAAIHYIFGAEYSGMSVERKTKFTVAGVLFERHTKDSCQYWRLSRQPFRRTLVTPAVHDGTSNNSLQPSEMEELCRKRHISRVVVSANQKMLGPNSPAANFSPLPYQNQGHLWDGRFWIHPKLRGNGPLMKRYIIRPLHPADVEPLSQAYEKSHTSRQNGGARSSVHYHLRRVAPGNIRFTLPVVAEVEEGSNWIYQENPGKVVALPTLGLNTDTNLVCDFTYKKVNLDEIGPSLSGNRPGGSKTEQA